MTSPNWVPFYPGGWQNIEDNPATTSSTQADAFTHYDAFNSEVSTYLAGLVPDSGTVGYDIVLLAGQSNMVSHGTGPTDQVYLDPPDPRIKQFGGSAPYLDQLVGAVDPLYHHEQRPGTVGHAMEFARNYVKTVPESRTVLLVPSGQPATGFTTSSVVPPPSGYSAADGGSWDTTGGAGGINLYEFAIAQANLAMQQGVAANNRVVAILWLQGEADAGALDQSHYAAAFDLLIDGFRSRITGASAAPFLVGQMLPQHIAAHSDFQAINAAHLDTPSRNESCAFYYGPVGTQYANSAADTELHYNNAGQRLLGDSSFSAYPLAIANVTGTPPVPPAAVTLRQSGTSVIATVTRSPGRVTDYTVQYRANGGSWSTLSHAATLDVAFTIPGFTLGDAVDVEISTVNEQGTSSPTTASLTLVHVPNAPTLGAATHVATAISPTWTAAGTGSPATSFLVEAGVHPAGGVYPHSVTVAAPATTAQISGLQPDTSYDYRVTPINAAGNGTAVTGTVSTDSIGFLLTDVGVSARFAVSVVRKLNTSYSGHCLSVRRSSDSTTLDIDFDGTGALDVASMLTFCGAGDGFVAKVYDQSGNGQDFAQATAGAQPKIVTSGALITRNGKPAMIVDGVDDCLDSSTVGLFAAGATSLLAVVELDSGATAANNFLSEGDNTSGKFALYTITRCVTGGLVGGQYTNDAGTGVTLANGSVAINTSAVVQVSAVDTGTQEANWISGNVSKALTTYTARTGVMTLNITRIGGLVNHQTAVTSPWQGAIQEVAAFTSVLTDPQRQAGELNQKSEFAIT